MASPITTNTENSEKADEKKDKKKRLYVSPHPEFGWQVRREGASRALKRFKTKVEAEEWANDLAKKQGVGIVRQKKDGKIQKKR